MKGRACQVALKRYDGNFVGPLLKPACSAAVAACERCAQAQPVMTFVQPSGQVKCAMCDGFVSSDAAGFALTLPEAVKPEGEDCTMCENEEAGATRAAVRALSGLACEYLYVRPAARTAVSPAPRVEILIRAHAAFASSLAAEVARQLAGSRIAYRLIISCHR